MLNGLEVKEESKGGQQKVDGGQDGLPLVRQGTGMRTEFSAPYSGDCGVISTYRSPLKDTSGVT
jgi:hypothetical protein